MKICLLTRSHLAEDPRLHAKLARSLSKAGHKVHIICRLESATDRIDEVIDGINYIGIPFTKLRKLDLQGTIKIAFTAVKLRADVYVGFEIRTLGIGLILKILRKIKLVYDCHEYWPEKIAEKLTPKHPALIDFLTSKLENWIARKSDIIWTVNRHLADRFRPFSKNVVVLPNYPTKELFGQNQQPDLDLAERFKNKQVLIYIGGMSEERGISVCLHVTKALKNIFLIFRCCFWDQSAPTIL